MKPEDEVRSTITLTPEGCAMYTSCNSPYMKVYVQIMGWSLMNTSCEKKKVSTCNLGNWVENISIVKALVDIIV